MTYSDHNRLPDELAETAELLRDNRPEATALELDGVKRQILARSAARARSTARKGQLMRSRFAMLAMIVFGLALSGGGAGLAVSGLSSADNSGVAQYGTTPTIPGLPCDANGDGVVTEDEDQNGPGVPGCLEDSGTLPTTDTGEEIPEAEVLDETDSGTDVAAPQPARQVEAGADTPGELPFTGFAAVPILIAGLALLGGGLVLRRRTAHDES
jgi:hypothetical protein